MITLPTNYAVENAKASNTPALLVKIQQTINEVVETTEADWGANSAESNVNYTTAPKSGDVVLVEGESVISSETGTATIVSSGGFDWLAFKITPVSSYSVIKVDLYLEQQALPNDCIARIYADSSGSPGTVLIASDTVNVTTAGWYTFTFTYPITLSASTDYWIGVEELTAATNIKWIYDNTGSGIIKKSDDGTTWVAGATGDARHRLYAEFIDTGYIQTQNMDLVTTPTINGEWILKGAIPTGCTVVYTAWASDTGAFGGEETSLGVILDGDDITVLERYYRVRATFTSSTDRSASPVLNDITADFAQYTNYAEDPSLEYEPAIKSVASVASTIDMFKKSTIGQTSLTTGHTGSISTWLNDKAPANKRVKIKTGFIADGFTESDYIDYLHGQVSDFSIGSKDEVSLAIQDYSKKWGGIKVPDKWETTGDDVVYTAWHPIDVILDLLLNYVLIRSVKLNWDSFQTVKELIPTWVVTRTITGNPADADKLLNELRVLMSCFFIPQNDGTIKIKRWDSAESSVASLTDDVLGRNTTYKGNTKGLINRTNIYSGHASPYSNDAEDFDVYNLGADAASQVSWDIVTPYNLKDKWTLTADTAQITDLQDNILDRFADKPAIITTSLDRRYIYLEAGDIVDITTKRAPSSDMMGISAVKFQIINRVVDHGGDSINLTLLEVAP